MQIQEAGGGCPKLSVAGLCGKDSDKSLPPPPLACDIVGKPGSKSHLPTAAVESLGSYPTTKPNHVVAPFVSTLTKDYQPISSKDSPSSGYVIGHPVLSSATQHSRHTVQSPHHSVLRTTTTSSTSVTSPVTSPAQKLHVPHENNFIPNHHYQGQAQHHNHQHRQQEVSRHPVHHSSSSPHNNNNHKRRKLSPAPKDIGSGLLPPLSKSHRDQGVPPPCMSSVHDSAQKDHPSLLKQPLLPGESLRQNGQSLPGSSGSSSASDRSSSRDRLSDVSVGKIFLKRET